MLNGAFKATLGKVARDQTGEPQPLSTSVELLVDVRDGAVRAGAVAIPALNAPCDFDADVAGLEFSNGTLEGVVLFKVLFPAGAGYQRQDGDTVACSVTLKATSDEKGGVKGTFTGESGGHAVNGAVSGERMARAAVPTALRVWLDFDRMPGVKSGYAVFGFEGGKAKPGGYFLFKKGYCIGEVSSQDLALDGQTLKGTFLGKIKGGAGESPVTTTLEGNVLASRLIFGNFKMAVEGGGTVVGRFRGGLCDANGPQIEGMTADQQKTVKEAQAAVGAAAK
jgi:hypothetical protein